MWSDVAPKLPVFSSNNSHTNPSFECMISNKALQKQNNICSKALLQQKNVAEMDTEAWKYFLTWYKQWLIYYTGKPGMQLAKERLRHNTVALYLQALSWSCSCSSRQHLLWQEIEFSKSQFGIAESWVLFNCFSAERNLVGNKPVRALPDAEIFHWPFESLPVRIACRK